MSNPIRPGARGGRDQFSWEKVKEDKQRINYLGSSIHGLPDKFKKGPETFWYAKETKTIPSFQDKTEIESIKDKEKRAMEALLGNSSKPTRSEFHRHKQETLREHSSDQLNHKRDYSARSNQIDRGVGRRSHSRSPQNDLNGECYRDRRRDNDFSARNYESRDDRGRKYYDSRRSNYSRRRSRSRPRSP